MGLRQHIPLVYLLDEITTMNKPDHGLSTAVYYVKNHDGDTVTVEIRRQFEVRLKDINAPELKDEGGVQARDFLTALLKDQPLTLFVPAVHDDKLMDSLSFTRVVGELWAGEINVGNHMVAFGHAQRVGKNPKMEETSNDCVKTY